MTEIDPTLPHEPAPVATTSSEHSRSMWIHLGAASAIIGLPVLLSLVLWADKRRESAFIDHHGRESINFQLSMVVYLLVANVSMWTLGWIMCGLPWVLMPVISFVVIVFAIVQIIRGAIHASNGKMFMYPVTIRFVK